jgi:hypothetical protein
MFRVPESRTDSAPQSGESNGPAGLRSLAKSCFRVFQFAFDPGTSRQWLLRPCRPFGFRWSASHWVYDSKEGMRIKEHGIDSARSFRRKYYYS